MLYIVSYSVPLEKHMFLFWKDTTIRYQGEPNLDYFTTLGQVTYFFLLIISHFFAIYKNSHIGFQILL